MAFGKLGARGGFGSAGVLGGVTYNPVAALGSDLIAYWDADSRYWGSFGRMTIATGVSSWKDIVGGYDANQATGSAQPAFSASAFNGGPGVSADGLDDCLTCTDAALLAALPTGATASELWALISQGAAAADTTSRYAHNYGGATTSDRRINRNVVTGVNRARALIGDGVSAASIQGSNVDLSSRHVIRLEVGASVSRLTVDGISEDSVSVVPASTAVRLRLFALAGSGTASSFWQGVGAVFMVTKPLSTSKAAALQSFLLSRRRL
jgi:hypothetical protein